MLASHSESTTGFVEHFESIVANIATVIRGKSDVIQLLVLALICDGHVLIEDVPGVGKTSLGKALARSVDGLFGRVQFTPDLLPSDVTGMSVWNRNRETFEFRPGPVFSDVLLADEINRAAPKTQSALLEAMAERQVTSDGVTHHLGSPFMVIATQNPIEHEGTYPLPEAQLDRFLLQIVVGYPDQEAENLILQSDSATSDALDQLSAVVSVDTVTAMTESLKQVFVAPALRQYLLNLAHATRSHPSLALGLSPRGVLALQRVARAQAAAHGRQYVTPDDVKALAPAVIPHRLLVTQEARMMARTPVDVVEEILNSVVVPRPERT